MFENVYFVSFCTRAFLYTFSLLYRNLSYTSWWAKMQSNNNQNRIRSHNYKQIWKYKKKMYFYLVSTKRKQSEDILKMLSTFFLHNFLRNTNWILQLVTTFLNFQTLSPKTKIQYSGGWFKIINRFFCINFLENANWILLFVTSFLFFFVTKK